MDYRLRILSILALVLVITVPSAGAQQTPILGGFATNIIWGSQPTFTVTGRPSGDVVNVYMTLTGQSQGAAIASGTTPYTYTLCSGANFCPPIGTYTVNVFDTDPTSNILNTIVYVPVNLINVTTTTPLPNVLQACVNNFMGGSCTGNVVYTTNTALKNNLFVTGNVQINSGQILTTNGFSIIVSGNFVNLGTISTGLVNNGGSVSSGGNLPSSYGGSGGGGGGEASAGSTPSAPSITNAKIVYWFDNGFENFLGGAGGGSGEGYGGGNTQASGGAGGFEEESGNGGSGANGCYIQANYITVGTVDASGHGGAPPAGGGGGGGTCIFAYGSTITSTGGVTVSGGGNGGAGSAVTYQYTTPPIPPLTYTEYYPIKFSTISPSSLITYTLTQIYGEVTTTPQSMVQNINYQPPSTQMSGIYQYNFTETQGTNTVTIFANVSINMIDINSSFTCTSPVIQYFPNFCNTPTFSLTPQSWYIKSDNPKNQYSNTVTGDQWSNANLSFAPNVILTYAGFTPFQANVLNNPAITSITQTAYLYQISNSITAATVPYTRKIINALFFDELSQQTMNANETFTSTTQFNNYTIPLSVASNTPAANSFLIYMPLGTYQNPSLTLLNETSFTTATNHIPITNNYFTATYNSALYGTLDIYLVGTANGTNTQGTITQCNNYASGTYVQVLYGVKGAQFQTQLYKPNSFPALIPLLAGYPYQFIVFNANGQQIGVSALNTWGSSWTVNIGCQAFNATPVIIPNIQTTCLSNNAPMNTLFVQCIGYDKNNIVKQWIINFTNQSSLLYSTVLKTYRINSSAFSVNYTYNSNKSEYPVQITGIAPDPNTYSAKITVGIARLPYASYTFFLFALMLILAPLVLAYFKQDVWLVLEIVVISIFQAPFTPSQLHIFPFTPLDMAIFYILGGALLVYDLLLRK